jgi:hypothetical protein
LSYDLMVFAVDQAPKERDAFLEWYDQETEWEEDHSYNDPAVTSPELQAWFLEMIKSYPPMNGPYSSDDLPEDEASVTDYGIGRSVIYAGFAWSKAEAAYPFVFALAAKHRVGFFDVSSENAAVWLPDGTGDLTLAHQD